MIAADAQVVRPSDSVRKIEDQDGAVLLDIRQGLCMSTTPVGAQIWNLLVQGRSLDEIADSLCSEFPAIAREEILNDAAKYVADLHRKGLLISGKRLDSPQRLPVLLQLILRWHRARSMRRRHSDRSLTLRALLGLLAFDVLRFGNNFTRLHRFVQQWAVAPGPASAAVVGQVCKAINYACIWYPKRVLCLQRSAVTTCLLRHCGVPAQMAMGAQKFPFKAHAWTEVNGHPINERRDVQRLYLVWERC